MHLSPDQLMEHGGFEFSAEASELRLSVGEWPERFETSLGNGMPLIRTSKKVRDGDLLYVRYNQELGCMTLIVFND
jgi:hypothetical protein